MLRQLQQTVTADSYSRQLQQRLTAGMRVYDFTRQEPKAEMWLQGHAPGDWL